MGASRVEMEIQRDGREFLVTVECLARDSALEGGPHPLTESGTPGPVCH